MNLSSRQKEILLALIHEYIIKAEPIGSHLLLEKYSFNFSSATIRSEMARLEEMGFLLHPYSSAGRVPTDKAYRYYVNLVMSKQFQTDYVNHYNDFDFNYYKFINIEELITHTNQILSKMSHYTSMILVPHFEQTVFKNVQLMQINESSILLIIVTNNGTLMHKVIETPFYPDSEKLNLISNMLNNKFEGISVSEIKKCFIYEEEGLLPEINNLIKMILDSIYDINPYKLFYEGRRNLLNQPEFNNIEKLKTLLSLLEEEDVICNFLKESLSQKDNGLKVFIGMEINNDLMKDYSVVTASYDIDNEPYGILGILGPTRMDYEKMIFIVNTMSQFFGKALEKIVSK